MNLSFFSADTISRALVVRFRDPSAVTAAVRRVNDLSQPFAHMFDASQEAFYAKLRKRHDGWPSVDDPAPQMPTHKPIPLIRFDRLLVGRPAVSLIFAKVAK